MGESQAYISPGVDTVSPVVAQEDGQATSSPSGEEGMHDAPVVDDQEAAGVAAQDTSEQDLSSLHISVTGDTAEELQRRSPSHNPPVIEQIDGFGGTWRLEPEVFQRNIVDLEAETATKLSSKTRRFYEKQNAMIASFVGVDNYNKLPDGTEGAEEEEAESPMASLALNVSFGVNIFLVVIKLIATIMSGSIAVLASFLDSLLDILSGFILFYAAYKAAERDTFKYPQGKTRLEPIGTVLFAVIMGLSALQILVETVKRFVQGIQGEPADIDMGPVPLAVLIFTIGIKAALYVFCHWVSEKENSPSVDAYAQDHANDVLTNLVALLGALLAAQIRVLWWADPVGAGLIAVYIIVTWWETGAEQVDLLTGKAASPEFLQKLTYLVYNHDKQIVKVDTVRAYHFGVNFLVEVDIVLPPDMALKQTHDIGESLQQKLEELEDVERAFVHIDWEWEHSVHNFEHKVGGYQGGPASPGFCG